MNIRIGTINRESVRLGGKEWVEMKFFKRIDGTPRTKVPSIILFAKNASGSRRKEKMTADGKLTVHFPV